MDRASSVRFLTLTYSDENIERNDQGYGILVPDHTKEFWKRLRKYQSRHSNKKIRYYLVGEYGGSENMRPHYHAIVFNLTPETEQK